MDPRANKALETILPYNFFLKGLNITQAVIGSQSNKLMQTVLKIASEFC